MSTAGTPSRRRTSALLVRLLIPGLLVMVLTESHAARTEYPLNVVFTLDISDSNPAIDRGIAYVSKTAPHQQSKHPDDTQTLVVFGKDAAVEVAPSRHLPLESIESEVGRGATNLEQALSMSLATIHDHEDGRIVLISDGNQTAGDVSRILPAVKARRVAVDVLPVEYSYEREVWLEGIELPQHVVVGETYDATVVLSATVAGKGLLTLNEEGRRTAKQSIDYTAGQNKFTVPFTVDRVGYHDYIASLEVARHLDNLTQNNTALNSLYVDGDRKVLLVTDGIGNRNYRVPFAEAVAKTTSALEVISAIALPRDAEQLASYDVIVFGDVSRTAFDFTQLKAVHDAVKLHGVGFLMFGGVNSLSPGNYHNTPIEDILPVSCDPSSDPESKAAVVVILDLIPSYDGGLRAKTLLSDVIQALGKADELGVIVHQKGDDVWLFPLTPVASSAEFQSVIDAAQFDRFLGFQNAMEAVLEKLLTRNLNTRHVLIVSDGSPRGPSTEMLQRYQKARISVSAAAIYPPTGQDHSSLSRITQMTHGQYYFANHPDRLVTVIATEKELLNRRALRQRTFVPTAGDGSAILDDLGEIPPLLGYVATSLKQEAVAQPLVIPMTDKSRDATAPLLAFGRYGMGRTAAFTSNFDTYWGPQWQSWPRFPLFVDRLLKELDRPKNLRISTQVTDEVATVIVNDLKVDDSSRRLNATVYGPDQPGKPLNLIRTAPQHYEAMIPLRERGLYRIIVTGPDRERQDLTFGAFRSIDSPELRQLSSNRQILQDIAATTGGRILSGDPKQDAVYAQSGRTLKYVPQGNFDWWLILLALLVPANALCQLVWHDMELAREQCDLPPVQSQTLQALFKTKKWVETALSTKGTARMLIQIWAPPPVRHASTHPAIPPTTPQDATHSSDSSSTTFEKLLAMKRRQNEHS